MRVSDGARKINRHGGAIFIHDDWREVKGIDVRAVADIPQLPIAPVEIRDFVCSRLIDLSPATLYPGAPIADEEELLARGLSECHFDDYGMLLISELLAISLKKKAGGIMRPDHRPRR